MKTAMGLFLLGISLVLISLRYDPYTDANEFKERYMQLGPGQSKEYWKLRDEMLTPKYSLEDYGGTACVAGIALLALILTKFRAPPVRWPLVVIAVLAPFASVGAVVFDLLLGASRGEFPHWADSLAIAFAGIPFELIILLAWGLGHLSLLKAPYVPARSLNLAISRKTNPWLIFVAVITCALLLLCAFEADYWYMVPGFLWLYLYVSLAAGRVQINDVQLSEQKSAFDFRGPAG